LKFTAFGFRPELLEGLDAMGFKDATPIQEQSIPAIMDGRDILACAQTGTGKTAAFLLPVLNQLIAKPNDAIDTLIIEPTRELAVQVDQQLEGFAYFTNCSSVAVYGGRDGQSMEIERKALKQGADIVVATPGRLTAHLDLGYVDFSKVRFLILDEADRMLDMGFAPAIMNIINRLPVDRQTLLFSATMPPQIRKFAQQMLRTPVEISLAVSKPAEKIQQNAIEVEDEMKIALTAHLLAGMKDVQRVIIFAGTKKSVKDLASSLKRRGLKADAIHSDLAQEERESKLASFRSGSLPIVVATDVLSRGIDIKGIDVVINFDVPGDAEDYVHRIGRTARADESGVAFTFINRRDRRKFLRIEELMGMKVKYMPLPAELAAGAARSTERQGQARGREEGGSRGAGRPRPNRRQGDRKRPPRQDSAPRPDQKDGQ
jgi:ATP-dependent RNA helicase RhlE